MPKSINTESLLSKPKKAEVKTGKINSKAKIQ